MENKNLEEFIRENRISKLSLVVAIEECFGAMGIQFLVKYLKDNGWIAD